MSIRLYYGWARRMSPLTRIPSLSRTHQNALVQVSIVHVQADPDDAAVIHLLVVEGQGEGGVTGDPGDGALVGAGGRDRCGGHGGGGGAAGAGARAHPWGVQRRQRGGLPELTKTKGQQENCVTKLVRTTTVYFLELFLWGQGFVYHEKSWLQNNINHQEIYVPQDNISLQYGTFEHI